MNELNNKIDEILYAFSNYWREGAHDTMPPGEYLTATQARKALHTLITEQVRLGREQELLWAKSQVSGLPKSHVGKGWYTRNTAFKNYAVKFWNNRTQTIRSKFDDRLAQLKSTTKEDV